MKRNSPRLTDGISRFLITVMGIVMMIAGIRLLIMGVDNFIQPIRHVGWVTTSANVTDISETVIKNNFFRNKRTRIHYTWTYEYVVDGTHYGVFVDMAELLVLVVISLVSQGHALLLQPSAALGVDSQRRWDDRHTRPKYLPHMMQQPHDHICRNMPCRHSFSHWLHINGATDRRRFLCRLLFLRLRTVSRRGKRDILCLSDDPVFKRAKLLSLR